MIPGVNIIGGKASVASAKRAGRSGCSLSPSSDSLRGWSPHSLRKCFDSKKYPDWLRIDLNAAKIITVQNYKRTKN